MAGLTDKQQRFIDEYIVDLNATQAAIRAGYSEKTARSIACELLTKPNIVDGIAEKRAKIAELAEWTAADRLVSLKSIHDDQAKLDPRVSISAIAEANKMQGSHAAVKSELTGKDGGAIAVSSTIDASKLSDGALEELILARNEATDQ